MAELIPGREVRLIVLLELYLDASALMGCSGALNDIVRGNDKLRGIITPSMLFHKSHKLFLYHR